MALRNHSKDRHSSFVYSLPSTLWPHPLAFLLSRSICQGEHVPWKEACVQKEDPREEVHPQPSLQRALCIWFALWRGPEGHQCGAAADGLWFRQFSLLQHYPWACGAGNICSRHPRRALEGDLWPPASPDRQMAWLGWGLEGPLCWQFQIWYRSDMQRKDGWDECLTNHYPLDFQWGCGRHWRHNVCAAGRVIWIWSNVIIQSTTQSLKVTWGLTWKAEHDTKYPLALNDSKDCHRKSLGNIQDQSSQPNFTVNRVQRRMSSVSLFSFSPPPLLLLRPSALSLINSNSVHHYKTVWNTFEIAVDSQS